MKIFASYQQTGIDKKELDKNLNKLKNIIEKIWHTTFIYHLDTSYENQTAKEIIYKVKNEIQTSDIIVGFINYPWKSEWMMQELWIAHWLNKKNIVFINKKYEEDYFLTYWISDNIIFFSDFDKDIEKILKYNIPVWI